MNKKKRVFAAGILCILAAICVIGVFRKIVSIFADNSAVTVEQSVNSTAPIIATDHGIYFTDISNRKAGYLNVIGEGDIDNLTVYSPGENSVLLDPVNAVNLAYLGFPFPSKYMVKDIQGNFVVYGKKGSYGNYVKTTNPMTADGKKYKAAMKDEYECSDVIESMSDSNNTNVYKEYKYTGDGSLSAYGYTDDLLVSGSKNTVQTLDKFNGTNLESSKFVMMDGLNSTDTSTLFAIKADTNGALVVQGTQAKKGSEKSFYKDEIRKKINMQEAITYTTYGVGKNKETNTSCQKIKGSRLIDELHFGRYEIINSSGEVVISGQAGKRSDIANAAHQLFSPDSGDIRVPVDEYKLKIYPNDGEIINAGAYSDYFHQNEDIVYKGEGPYVEYKDTKYYLSGKYSMYHSEDDPEESTPLFNGIFSGNENVNLVIKGNTTFNIRGIIKWDPVEIPLNEVVNDYLEIPGLGESKGFTDLFTTGKFTVVETTNGEAWAIGANPNNVWGLDGDAQEYYTEFIKLPYNYDDIVLLNNYARVVNTSSGREYFASNNCFANASQSLLNSCNEFYITETDAVLRINEKLYCIFGSHYTEEMSLMLKTFYDKDGVIEIPVSVHLEKDETINYYDTTEQLKDFAPSNKFDTRCLVGNLAVTIKNRYDKVEYKGTFKGSCEDTSCKVSSENGCLFVSKFPSTFYKYTIEVDDNVIATVDPNETKKYMSSYLNSGSHHVRILAEDIVIFDDNVVTGGIQISPPNNTTQVNYVAYAASNGDYITLSDFANPDNHISRFPPEILNNGISYSIDGGETWSDWLSGENARYIVWKEPVFTLKIRTKGNPSGDDAVIHTQTVDISEKVNTDTISFEQDTDKPYKFYVNGAYRAANLAYKASGIDNVKLEAAHVLLWYSIDGSSWKLLYPENNPYFQDGYNDSGNKRPYAVIPSGTHNVKVRLGYNQMLFDGDFTVDPVCQVSFDSASNKFLFTSEKYSKGDFEFSINNSDFTTLDNLPTPTENGTYTVRLKMNDTIVDELPVEVELAEKKQPDVVKVDNNHFKVTAYNGESLSYTIDNGVFHELKSGVEEAMLLDGEHRIAVFVDNKEYDVLFLKYSDDSDAPKLLEDYSCYTDSYRTYYQDGYDLKVIGEQTIASVASIYSGYNTNKSVALADIRTYSHFTKLFNLHKFGLGKVVDVQNEFFKTESGQWFSYGAREPIPIKLENYSGYGVRDDCDIYYPLTLQSNTGSITQSVIDNNPVVSAWYSDTSNRSYFTKFGSDRYVCALGNGEFAGFPKNYGTDGTSALLSYIQGAGSSQTALKEVRAYGGGVCCYPDETKKSCYQGEYVSSILALNDNNELILCKFDDTEYYDTTSDKVSTAQIGEDVIDFTCSYDNYWGADYSCYAPVFITSNGSVTFKGSYARTGPGDDYTFTADDLGSPAVALAANGFVLTEEGKVFDIHTGSAVQLVDNAAEITSEYYLRKDGQVYTYDGELEPVDYKTTKDVGIRLDESDIDINVEHIVLSIPDGFTSIKCPNGETSSLDGATTYTYTVRKNGSYVFELTNKYGDTTKKLAKVYNISDRIKDVPQVKALGKNIDLYIADNALSQEQLVIQVSSDGTSWKDYDGNTIKYTDKFYARITKRGEPGHSISIEEVSNEGKLKLNVTDMTADTVDVDTMNYSIRSKNYMKNAQERERGYLNICSYKDNSGRLRSISDNSLIDTPEGFMQGDEERYIDSSYKVHTENLPLTNMYEPADYWLVELAANYQKYVDLLGMGSVAEICDNFVLTTEGEILCMERPLDTSVGNDPTKGFGTTVDTLPDGTPSQFDSVSYGWRQPSNYAASSVKSQYSNVIAGFQFIRTKFAVDLDEHGFYWTEDDILQDDIVRSVFYKVGNAYSSVPSKFVSEAMYSAYYALDYICGYYGTAKCPWPVFFINNGKVYISQMSSLTHNSSDDTLDEAGVTEKLLQNCEQLIIKDELGIDVTESVTPMKFGTYLKSSGITDQPYINYNYKGTGASYCYLPIYMMDNCGRLYKYDRAAGAFQATGERILTKMPNVSYSIDDVSWTNCDVNVQITDYTSATPGKIVLNGENDEKVIDATTQSELATTVGYNDMYKVKVEDMYALSDTSNINISNIDKLAPSEPTFDNATKSFIDGEDAVDSTGKYATSGVNRTEISLNGTDWINQEKTSVDELVKQGEKKSSNSILDKVKSLFGIINTHAADDSSFQIYARTFDNAGNVSGIVSLSVDDAINEHVVYRLGETEVDFTAEFSVDGVTIEPDTYAYRKGSSDKSGYDTASSGNDFIVTEDSTYTLYAEKGGQIIYKVIDVKVVDIKKPTIVQSSTDESKAIVTAGECINSTFSKLYYQLNTGEWNYTTDTTIEVPLRHGENVISAYTVNNLALVGPTAKETIIANLASTEKPIITVTESGTATIAPGEIVGDTLYKIYYTTDNWATRNEYTDSFKVSGDYEIKAYQVTAEYRIESDIAVATGSITSRHATINGTVKYKNGTPIVGQDVVIGTNTVKTDSAGAFSTEDVAIGKCSVKAARDGSDLISAVVTVADKSIDDSVRITPITGVSQEYSIQNGTITLTIIVDDCIDGSVDATKAYRDGETDVQLTSEITENGLPVIAEEYRYLRGEHLKEEYDLGTVGDKFTATETSKYTIYAKYKNSVFSKVIDVDVYTIENDFTYGNGETYVNFREENDSDYKYTYSYADDKSGHEFKVTEDTTVKVSVGITDDISISKDIDIIVIKSEKPNIVVDDSGKTTITAGKIIHDTLDKIYYRYGSSDWKEYRGIFNVTGKYTVEAYQTTATYKVKSDIAKVSGEIKKSALTTEAPPTEAPPTEAPPTTETPPTTEAAGTDVTTEETTTEETTTEETTTEETTTEESTTEEPTTEKLVTIKEKVHRLIVPKTGDETPILLYIDLAMLGLAGIIIFSRKKK